MTSDDVLLPLGRDFAALLRQERRRRGVSLRELEAATGVPFNTIRRIETLGVDPRLSTVIPLLKWIHETRSTE